MPEDWDGFSNYDELVSSALDLLCPQRDFQSRPPAVIHYWVKAFKKFPYDVVEMAIEERYNNPPGQYEGKTPSHHLSAIIQAAKDIMQKQEEKNCQRKKVSTHPVTKAEREFIREQRRLTKLMLNGKITPDERMRRIQKLRDKHSIRWECVSDRALEKARIIQNKQYQVKTPGHSKTMQPYEKILAETIANQNLPF